MASSMGVADDILGGLAEAEKPRAYLRNIGVGICVNVDFVVPPIKLLPILPAKGRNVFMGNRRRRRRREREREGEKKERRGRT